MMLSYDANLALNGEVMAASAAHISPLGEGVMFGRGLFETIKVIGGRPAFFDAHHARLAASCLALGLPWREPVERIRRHCIELLSANGREEGSLKIVILAEEGGCAEIVMTRGVAYPDEHYRRGFRLNVQFDLSRRDGPAHKSTAYLANFLARQKARERGADDALFVNHRGEAIEGSATNLFVVAEGSIFTPPLEQGPLPGIARGEILRHWKERGAREQPITRELLKGADEVFVTNALLGVMPVAYIDDVAYPLTNDSITRELMREFSAWQVASR